MRLTRCEQEVMEVFWEAGKPLSQSELIDASPNRSWKARSVYILLNGLLEKGVLREAGFIRSGKAFARQFEPTVTYESLLVDDYFEHVNSKPSFSKIMSAFLGRSQTTSKELDDLEAMIAEKKRLMDK